MKIAVKLSQPLIFIIIVTFILSTDDIFELLCVTNMYIWSGITFCKVFEEKVFFSDIKKYQTFIYRVINTSQNLKGHVLNKIKSIQIIKLPRTHTQKKPEQ